MNAGSLTAKIGGKGEEPEPMCGQDDGNSQGWLDLSNRREQENLRAIWSLHWYPEAQLSKWNFL